MYGWCRCIKLLDFGIFRAGRARIARVRVSRAVGSADFHLPALQFQIWLPRGCVGCQGFSWWSGPNSNQNKILWGGNGEINLRRERTFSCNPFPCLFSSMNVCTMNQWCRFLESRVSMGIARWTALRWPGSVESKLCGFEPPSRHH
jgi:hypothetical protein